MRLESAGWIRPIWPFVLLALAWPRVASPANATDGREAPHPRTALVLSGGGARGAAHVGVLEVLEELQVPIDVVIGTSMGAIVGGLYSSGLSPERMQEAISAIDWEASFDDRPPRRHIPFRQKEIERKPLFNLEFGFGKGGLKMPSGIVAGQKLNFILRTLTLHASKVKSFDDLAVPFRAVAVDLETGETVVLDHGDLAQAMRASMAFPLIFTPEEIDGRLLVDGGVTLNLPVEVALEMGAERIIAVDVSTPLKKMRDKTSALSVMRRTTSVMAKQGQADQRAMLREQDLLIVPELEGITTFGGFEKIHEAVQAGVRAARAVEDRLREFSVPAKEFELDLAAQRSGSDPLEVNIAEVEVVGVTRLSPRLVAQRIKTRPGQRLDLEILQKDLERVYKTGQFEQVAFLLEPIAGSDYRLVVEAVERSWGPWFVRPGAGIEANLDSRGRVTLLALVERPQLNRLNGEWRTWIGLGDRGFVESELYQPLDHTGTLFVAPRIEFARTNEFPVWVLDAAEYVSQDLSTGHLDLGLALGNWAELRAGITTGHQEAEAKFLEVDPPQVDVGGYSARFRVDTLDHPNFPRQGTLVDVQLSLSRSSMGADAEFDRLNLLTCQAWRLGRRGSMGARLRFGTDLGSDLPYYAAFALGGLFNLSGTNIHSLVGPRMALGELVYFQQVGELPGILGGDTYIGGSLEAGNVWQAYQDPVLSDLIYAGSLFVGVDTLLGPIYLAYGHASNGDNNLYIYLGRLF